MKKILLETSFSKIYMIVMVLISILVVGGYFSYAMFTVTKEKSNAISIVTGNLTYKLEVDGEESNILSVPGNTTKEFIITLSNPNNRVARFNFYYVGSLASNVTAGYKIENSINIPPVETGINLEKIGTAGSSNTYKIRVVNDSSSSITITLGVSVGLDYNDLALPSNGHLFEEYEGVELYKVLLKDEENNINTSDREQTFITGEAPNNYIWYSGKLWRAVSIDPEDNSVKLVTQWNISAIPYDDSSSSFKGSHMEIWLNDTSVDGFLGNLREPEKFIKMDSKWNATMTTETSKPPKTTIVEDSVGLLTLYENIMICTSTTYDNCYIENGLVNWMLTPCSSTELWYSSPKASSSESDRAEYLYRHSKETYGVRASINLKPEIKTVDGKGTEEDPYRLEGDNDTNLSGTLLNTRYSGEYIKFGTGENTLYRIVSHEVEGQTKITSAEPLKENSKFKTSAFGNNTIFSSSNTIGRFLNNDYLNNGVYLTSEQKNMIENNTVWYLGQVGSGQNYRLSKYKDINMSSRASSTISTVGLLRTGELMSGQFNRYTSNVIYWLMTPYDSSYVRFIYHYGYAYDDDFSDYNPSSYKMGVKPALNLKSNVIITRGDGTLQDPFEIELSS